MPIHVETHPGYRVITLSRPERLNALTVEMADALIAALARAEADKSCRAVVLTGSGRAFCAGQDLAAVAGLPAGEIGRLLDHYNPMISMLRALPVPVIAAVNGVAAGAGANLALACDIVLAARSASFIQAFTRVGLIPDCGGTWFLPRLMGMARARALALLAEPLPAERAEDWGMIWRAIDDDRLLPEAHALAARLAAQPALALALTKRALDESMDKDLSAQLDLERDLQEEASAHPDHAEGVRAFLEKRPVRFKTERS